MFSAELPTLEEAMARLQGEETRREMMGGTSATQEKPEALAMAVNKTHNLQPKGRKSKRCDHCRRDGHERSKCWHLHPELRPVWWDESRTKNPKGERKGYAAQTIKSGEEKAKSEVTREDLRGIRAEVSSLLPRLNSLYSGSSEINCSGLDK
jgi:hypothetical protein